MADVSDINAAQSVKIIGADATGVESTPVTSTATGNLNVADVSNNGGVQGALSVTTSAVEAKVGGSPLANRKTLTIHNNGTGTLYWGYSNSVTSSTGTPIFKDQLVVFDIGTGTSVFLIASSGSHNTRITESA